MKIETIKRENGIIFHSNEFNDLYEMVDYIRNTKPNLDKWIAPFSEASDEARNKFVGTKSLDEALELCLGGYSSEARQIIDFSDQLQDAFPKLKYKRRVEHSNYGFRPDVIRALHNNPNSMYKLVRKPKAGIVDFYFNVTSPKKVSNEAILNKGIITIALIKFLESINYRVNLNLFSLSFSSNEFIYTSVILKAPGQLLDTNTCSFPMTHPSFNRRMCFAVNERIDVINKSGWTGYGRPCDREVTIEVLNLDKNAIVLDSPIDLEVSGKDLIEDTVNLINNSNFNSCLGDGQRLDYDESQKKFVLTR